MADALKNFEAGHEYATNGEVTAANLQKLVTNAAPLATIVSQRDQVSTPADPSLIEVLVRDGNLSGGAESKTYRASSVDWLNLKETIGTPNLSLGEGSGGLSSTGSSNVLIGNEAGKFVDTGSLNVALGHKALKSDSGASLTRNVAIGNGAMERLNAATQDNVAIGTNALNGTGPDGVNHSTAQASNNVAVGSNAGEGITGPDNIAIGSNALQEGNSSNLNVALGHDALKASSSGASNVALGHSSMVASDSLANNVAVGNQTLTATADVSENVAIGHKAAELSQGDKNVLIGVEAGRSTVGDQNTVVGYKAMSSASDASYINCVVLGASASPNRNNQIVLGNLNMTHVKLPMLPTSDAGLVQGELYTDSGTVKQKQ